MNLKINILTKKGITKLDIFSLFYHKFHKITKTVLMVVADVAIGIFLSSLNGDNNFPHI